MASPPGYTPSQYEPVGCWGHCSAIVNGKQYTYGGDCGAGGVPTLMAIDIFDFETELWQQTPTSGEPPPGFHGASCAVIRAQLFHFGGADASMLYNFIHELDTRALRWNPITAINTQEGPRGKYDAGMVSYNEKLLVISGGYTGLPDQRLPGREYVHDPTREGYGWTNEVHCFHVDSSELC